MHLIYFLLISLAQAQTPQHEVVKGLVKFYNTETIQRFGQEIKLSFIKSESFQLIGGRRDGNLVLDVFQKVLTDTTEYELVAATCHELGHILGQVPISMATPNPGFDPRDNVEGEADYFGGACTREYLIRKNISDPVSIAIQAERDLFIKIYKETPNAEIAEKEIFNGISGSYPSLHCRFLSSQLGVLKQPRPRCWYNP